uniref:Uncharacterized protein n=1 Tax=Yoonia rhodophyticola TaxID=3137370 RepID=A0AAN0MEE7_9RHOB
MTAADHLTADTLRYENRANPEIGALAVAQIRAYLQDNNFDAAFGLLDEEADILAGQRDELENELALSAASNMENAAFLELAFDPSFQLQTTTAEYAFAARLIDLGFPDRATILLTSRPEAGFDTRRQELLATAFLASGQPGSAREVLEGVAGNQAELLRLAADDLSAGDQVSADLSIGEEQPASQWRRGAWQELLQSDDTLLQAASSAVNDNAITDLDDQEPLASGRNLAEEASRTRDLLDALLQRFQTPEPL